MSKPKFTPGPWFTDATEDTIFVVSDASDVVAAIELPRDGVSVHEETANARLISAAPELLEALYECILTITTGDTTPEELKRRIERAEEVYFRAGGTK